MPENPADVVARWQKALAASSGKYKEKVQAVTSSPMEAAARKKDKMIANLTESVMSGKWERGLRSVDLQTWKQKTAELGASRLASGAAAAAPKMQKVMEQLLPFTERVSAEIQAMPDATFEDRIQRMVANATKMAAFKMRG